MLDLDSLKEAETKGSLNSIFEIVFHALVYNYFTEGLHGIVKLNLPTLRIRYPEVYETIKDKEIRKELVIAELFDVSRFKGLKEDDLELDYPNNSIGFGEYSYVLEALNYIGSYKYGDKEEEMYGGKDAPKVFFQALYTLCEILYEKGDATEEVVARLWEWLNPASITYLTHKEAIDRGIKRLIFVYRTLKGRKNRLKILSQ